MSQSEQKEKASSQTSTEANAAVEETKSEEPTKDAVNAQPTEDGGDAQPAKDENQTAEAKSEEAVEEAKERSEEAESSSVSEDSEATSDVIAAEPSGDISAIPPLETLEITDDGDVPPPPSSAIRNQNLVAAASALQEEVADLKKKLQDTRRAHLEEQLHSKRNADENKKLQAEMKQVAKEKDELYERLVRLSADFDNLRKRSQREREDSRKYGHEGLVKELLPMFDNFDLALKSMTDADAPASVVEGIQMLYKQYLDILHHHGVQRFEAKGQVFDYTLHEAISLVETDEVPDGTVFSEFRAGYKLHDRLLRPSMVAVAKAPAKPVEAAPAEAEKDEENATTDAPPEQDVASQADATSQVANETTTAPEETETKAEEAGPSTPS